MDIPLVVVNGGTNLDAGQWQHRDGLGLMYRPRSEDEKSALLSGALVARVPVATTLLDMEVRWNQTLPNTPYSARSHFTTLFSLH